MSNTYTLKMVLITLALIFTASIPKMVGAQDESPGPLFPGEATSDFRVYIQNFYQFAIPASVLVATVMIMIGGVIWITSAGSQQRITKAKEFVIQPIIGVIILMGAYVLLAYINPALVELKLPSFPELEGAGACINSSGLEGKGDDCLRECAVQTQANCGGGKIFREGVACQDYCRESFSEERRREEEETERDSSACSAQVDVEVYADYLESDEEDCQDHCETFTTDRITCDWSSVKPHPSDDDWFLCTCRVVYF